MSRLQANLLLLLAAMIWGTTFVVQKKAFQGGGELGAMGFTAARFLIGALVVLPLAWRERGQSPLSRGDWALFALCGLLLLLGAWMQQIGIILTSVTNAGFLTGLYVPLVPIFALLLFRRRAHWAVWPAALGCVTGTWFLSGGSLTKLGEGDLWVLAGAVFWALHMTLIGITVVRTGRALTLAFTQFMTCALLAFLAASFYEPMSLGAFAFAWKEILWAGAMSVGIAFTLQVIGQRHTHPAAAAIILSSEMAFAALGGVVFLGEGLSPQTALGGALILTSIIAVEALPAMRLRRKAAAV